MNIGQAAIQSGVNARLIRHYESIGLIPKAGRSEGGYRVYSENEIHILIFVRRARSLGFSMKEIKKLIDLWRNRNRNSAEVKALTHTHIQDLDKKIRELEDMRKTLMHLSRTCQGNERPECPILNELSKK